jgi:serine/threonine protein kinase
MNYLSQVGQALQHLHHKGIHHNDIKLENILVMNKEIAKLADFGFAAYGREKFIERWERRSINIYSAPEISQFTTQIKELREFDPHMGSIDFGDGFDE